MQSDKTNTLHICCLKGHLNLAKILIKEKINIYQQDIFGQTPLHFTIVHNQLELIKLFLDDEKL